MPVNYVQLQSQMKNAGKTLKLRQDAFSKAADHYESRLRDEAGSETLRQRVEAALVLKPDTRCAVPRDEAIDHTFPKPELPPVQIRLLACDGSQITPSRHDEISFGLINTAVVAYTVHSGKTPEIITRTELLDFNDLPSEDMVGVRRDAAEKSFLAETAANTDSGLITFALCDGPLELFSKTPEIKDYERYRKEYHDALALLAASKAPAVGYIDRPGSDPVLQMLELTDTGASAVAAKAGANDSMVFSRLLGPGERSAVFSLHSASAKELEEDLRTCFFYLNIGRPGHPYISRVEFPAWAADEMTTGLLHAVLIDQCGILGGHPYPFVLHRAHECAVVTYAEKEEVKGMLLREMAASGLAVPQKSNKQIAKDNMGNKK